MRSEWIVDKMHDRLFALAYKCWLLQVRDESRDIRGPGSRVIRRRAVYRMHQNGSFGTNEMCSGLTLMAVMMNEKTPSR